LKKLLAALVAGVFAIASVGVFAASHTGAAPMKDGKKDEMKKDDGKKGEAKKDDGKKGEAKKDDMKKDDGKKDAAKK
jgi:pentapeptide MXKDX repeat protein